MVNYRLISIIRKEFIQIWRDPRTLALILVMPLMQLILLGYVFKTEVTNLPLAVFDQDRGPGARNLLDAYRAADYFEINFDVDSEDEISALIDSGDVSVGLIIPPDYSSKIRGDGKADVVFVIDGSDPTVASTALAVAQQIGTQHATRIQMQRLYRAGLSGTGEMPLEIHTQVWFNPDMIDAYCELHQSGYAHSVEAWYQGNLAGGLYGIALGRSFFGESMFSTVTDASKVAFVHFVKYLEHASFDLIDCQISSKHLMQFGAREIDRTDFLTQLAQSGSGPSRKGRWHLNAYD